MTIKDYLASTQDAALLAALAQQNYPEIARLLNAPTANVPNPDPQAQVPRVLSLTEILALLSAASKTSLKTWLGHPNMAQAIFDQNREVFLEWAKFAQLLGNITAAEVTALTTYANAEVPDPDWPATVPGASAAQTNEWGTVRAEDVQQALL